MSDSKPVVADEASESSPSAPARISWRMWLGIGLASFLLIVGSLAGFVVYQLFFYRPSQTREIEITAPVEIEETTDENKQQTTSRPNPVLTAFGVEPTPDNNYSLKIALDIARKSRERYREQNSDYISRLYRAERHGDELVGSTVQVKIRDRDEEAEIPFSVYLRYIEPEAIAGREVIYVENANDGNLIAHKEGALNLFRLHLKPDSMLAMAGNKYPITMIGLENMLTQMIERGERELKHGECEVDIHPGHAVGEGESKRVCTLINIWHREKKPEFDFCLLQIYVDEELLIPIRYAAYTWPEEGTENYVLQEEYSYFDLQLNVGHSDAVFDPDNEAYDFP